MRENVEKTHLESKVVQLMHINTLSDHSFLCRIFFLLSVIYWSVIQFYINFLKISHWEGACGNTDLWRYWHSCRWDYSCCFGRWSWFNQVWHRLDILFVAHTSCRAGTHNATKEFTEKVDATVNSADFSIIKFKVLFVDVRESPYYDDSAYHVVKDFN